MKKYILSAIIIFCGILSMQSCKKPGHDTQYITLNESIHSGDTYTLNLRNYGDDDDAPSITKQATDYTISQINNTTYNFSTTTKSLEKQTVVITLTEDHHGGFGACNNNNKTEAVITINFTIL